jgi:hypothetical protein
MRKRALHQLDQKIAQKSRVRRANGNLRIGRIKRNLNDVGFYKSNKSSKEEALVLKS